MKPHLALVALLLWAACDRDEAADHPVNGAWDALLEIRGETQRITFDFEADGRRLEGEIRAAKSTKIVDGTIQGSVLSFKQVVPLPDGSQTTATYKGTLRGDEITFTVVLLGSENRFTAARRTRRVRR